MFTNQKALNGVRTTIAKRRMLRVSYAYVRSCTPYSLLCTKEESTLVLLSLYFIRAYAAYHRPQKKNTHTLAYVQFLLYLCARILKLTIRQTGRKMNGHPGKKKRENEKRAEICQDARLRE